MLEQYLPILIFIVIGLLFGIAPIIAGFFVSPKKPDQEKRSSYECGFEPFSNTRIPFDIRFYLVAILFILFDLETAFLFPWAVSFRSLGWFGIGSMGIFLSILIVGFIYEWKKGALEWE